MPKSHKDFQPTNANNTLVDPIKELRSFIEETFENLEQQIAWVENKISSQYVDIRNSISAIKLGESNSSLISENTDKIKSHTFGIDSLNERIMVFKNHLNMFQDDLDQKPKPEEDPHFLKH